MPDTERNSTPEPPIRDSLALERTRLANERTMLAYCRTAIMLAASGATVIKLFASPLALASGWGLIALSCGVGGVGAARFASRRRKLESPQR